jgi:hypothetical protein
MLRLREKAERTPHDFYESAMKEIVFSQPVVVADTVVSSASTAAGVASGAAAASSNKRTSPAEKENLLAPLVLATTAAGGAFPAEQADGGGSAENNLDFFSLGLIAAGMVLSGAAVVAGLAREKIIAAVLGIIKRV